MTRRTAAPADDPRESPDEDQPAPGVPTADEPTDRQPRAVDLTGLSVAGITRRRVGLIASAFLAMWIVVVFARQVGDATAAANRASQLAADNAALAAEVESLQAEAEAIVQPAHVGLAARAHQLGDPREIPFTLAPSVAAPVDGAPGSASVRLGSSTDHQTPLESWLSLLFGPAG